MRKEYLMRTANRYVVVAVVVFLGIGASALAVDIEGRYMAKGTNPGEEGEYAGEVIISKTGDTYRVVWHVGTTYVGTGIVLGNVLSVGYVDESNTRFGTVVYTIEDGGAKLEGLWCPLGSSILGTETLEKESERSQ
jgi:hypothetical protein